METSDRMHHFSYTGEGASKRIRHLMPSLIHLLLAGVMLKIDELDLK